MEEFRLAIALIFLIALALIIIFSVCRCLGLWTWTMNWIFSSREEKVNLTRSDGLYNANGCLIPGESMCDINLCHSGSFKRFETVDHEYAFEMSDFTSEPTLQQPPEQIHDYPQDVSLPFGDIEMSNDQSDGAGASNWDGACGNDLPESTTVFISSSPTHRQASTAFIKYPPQPLRPAPSPTYSMMTIHEKYESEKPEKVKCKPKRPPPPFFSQVVSPPVSRRVFFPPASSQVVSPPASSQAVPPPVLGQIVPPPIPPRIRPPPLPPRRFPSQQWFERDDALAQLQGLQRGVSFESLSSDTSVVLADLDGPHVTGHLCVGLGYNYDSSELFVTILEGKDLNGLEHDGHTLMDTFVRVYMLPDKFISIQTRICRNSNSPSYKGRFLFHVGHHEFRRQRLCFYVYSAEINECVLIGEGELRLSDVSTSQAVTTWVTLTDTGQFKTEWGEIMLSLNYLPTAERLTVVVVKAKNLVFPDNRETGDPFVKVYLLKQGKKLYKKKTSTKHGERDPIYNEAMIFNIPPATLQNLQLRVTVADNTGEPRAYSLGHVIMGKQAIGKTYSHWIQMMTSPRRPISMWHSLAK